VVKTMWLVGKNTSIVTKLLLFVMMDKQIIKDK
jgi:hypothetical protein